MWNRLIVQCRVGLVVGLIGAIHLAPALGEDRAAGGAGEPVAPLPPAVVGVLSNRFPDSTIISANFRYVWGTSAYRIELRGQGGQQAVDVTADGTLLGTNAPCPVEILAAPVKSAAAKVAKGMSIVSATREEVFAKVTLSKRDKPTVLYDVLVMKGDRKGLIIVGEDGAVLQSIRWRDPVFVPDRDLRAPLPAAARASLLRAFERANILEVEEEQEHGIGYYNVEVIGDGVEQHAKVTAEGIILEVLGPVAPGALPEAVRRAALEAGGAGALLGVSEKRRSYAAAKIEGLKTPLVLYRLTLEKEQTRGEMIVDADGVIRAKLCLSAARSDSKK